jgi:hypothetical protein
VVFMLCIWGTLYSCQLICIIPALPHHLSLTEEWRNAARLCQERRHQRGVSAVYCQAREEEKEQLEEEQEEEEQGCWERRF